MSKRILVFTGGGLAPALNPTLFGVIDEAKKQNFNVLGGLFGWACLLDNGKIIELKNLNINDIKNVGGTFLRSSRTNPFNIEGGIEKVKKTIKEKKIDLIVAIGGDDTLGAANKLFNQEGMPIIGIPKTIDNDLPETYWAPGFPSAAYYYSDYVEQIREDAAYALSRIYIIESLGRSSGWLVASAIYGGADIIIPPEKEIKVDDLLNLVEKKYKNNGNFAVIAIAEEAKFDQKIQGIIQDQDDSFQVKRTNFISLPLKDLIKEKLGINTKALIPGNYLESGKPIGIDQKYAIQLGRDAIKLAREEKFGRMVRIYKEKNVIKINSILLDDVFSQKKERRLAENMFDWKNFQPTQPYLDYMEPILGKYHPQKEEGYNKILEKIKKY